MAVGGCLRLFWLFLDFFSLELDVEGVVVGWEGIWGRVVREERIWSDWVSFCLRVVMVVVFDLRV